MRNPENFMYSEFSTSEERESSYRKGHIHRIERGVRCPGCNEEQRPIAQGRKTKCACGLILGRSGNRLTVGETESQVAAGMVEET